MKKIIYIIILLNVSIIAFGQSDYERFKTLFEQNDTIKINELINNWEKTNSDDPELYTSAFNYYFSNSQEEIISFQQGMPTGESFAITDSTGQTVAYLGSGINYNREKLKKVFYYIDKGIEKFPDRLDMRLGKCYVLGEIKDYKNFTSEIINTVNYSLTNKNNWLWSDDKILDDAQNFMLGAIQTYLLQLYNTEDDDLLNNMIEIGDVILKNYPSHIEILSTTAVALLLTENFDKAIMYLKQAEKLNPEDFIVLNNIAQAYKLKGDKQNAIKYYELTEKFGDEQAKAQAKDNLESLKQ